MEANRPVSVEDTDSSNDGSAHWSYIERAAERCEAELARASVFPEEINLKVGNLTVRTKPQPAGTVVAGFRAEVLLDGRPFPVKSLLIKLDVDDVARVTMEFYPRHTGQAVSQFGEQRPACGLVEVRHRVAAEDGVKEVVERLQ